MNGSNTVVYDGSGITSFTFTLQNFTGTLTDADFHFLGTESGTGGGDTITGGRGILGFAGNDSLTGTDAGNVINAGAGDDTVRAGNYGQIIYGGSGNDSLIGAYWSNHLYGGSGNDTLSTTGNGDTLTGGSGADIFKFTAANSGSVITDFSQSDGDKIEIDTGLYNHIAAAGAGDAGDLKYSVNGSNTIVYDTISGFSLTLDNFTAALTDSDFSFVNTQGSETLSGGAVLTDGAGGTDSLTATANFATLSGGAGNDTLDGATNPTGGDQLYGGSGNDSITTFANSQVYGGSGDDTINSTWGGNTIYGGSGNDSIISTSDTMYGGAGNDTLSSFGDHSTLTGGTGADVFQFTETYNTSHITDVSQSDGDKIEIDIGLYTHIAAAGSGDAGDLNCSVNGSNTVVYDSITGFGFTLDNFTGALTDSNFSFVNTQGNETLNGADRSLTDGAGGNDSITGAGQLDTLFGGAGSDTITDNGSGPTYDVLYGGAGDDSLVSVGDYSTLYGGSGNDTISAGPGGYFYGGSGNDSITALGNSNYIDGGDGNDTIIGNPGYGNTLAGGNGNDSIMSDTGYNSLDGGSGNDTLVSAGNGYDTMIGGSGEDIFKFTASHSGSVITDFNQATDGDLIDLTTWSGMHFDGTAAMSGSVNQVDYSQSGGNTIVSVDTNGDNTADFSFQLTGLYTLTREDFIFQGDTDGTGGNDSLSRTGNIFGLAGNDSLASGASFVSLYGGSGNDSIGHTEGYYSDSVYGGDGNDTLVGGNYSTVSGDAGNDSLVAHGASSTLIGGAGADTMSGGSGTTFLYAQTNESTAAASDVIHNYIPGDSDIISLQNAGFTETGINNGAADANNLGWSFDGTYSTITSANYDFTLKVESRDVTIQIGNNIYGTPGGDNTLFVTGFFETAYGGTGNDSIAVGDWLTLDTLYGGSGNDTLTTQVHSHNILLDGGSGDNSLASLGSYNTLVGGSGNDTLASYGNNDLMTGGTGTDTFVFNNAPNGSSTITDMTNAESDKIALSNSVFNFASGPIAQGTGLNDNVDIYQVSSTFGGGKFMDGSHSETFLYDATNGHVWYEQDGSHNAVLVATVSNFATYTYHAADFVGWA